MHFILSEDETFPDDETVQAAHANPGSEESEATLAECRARFGLKPATTLRAMMPTLLDKWDDAYTTHLSQGTDYRFGNNEHKEWAKSWRGYSQDLVDALIEAEEASMYVILPKRAVARLRWMLGDKLALHSMTPFPTSTVISTVDMAFQDNGEALCDVSICHYFTILIRTRYPSDKYHTVLVGRRAINTAWYLSPEYWTGAGR